MIGFDNHNLVQRHFSGEGYPSADRRLFRHLGRCERCREEYRTYATLESLDRDGEDRARERLARTIFPRPQRRRRLLGAGFGVVALASVATLMMFKIERPSDGFQARGGPPRAAAASAVEIYRIAGDGRSERAGSSVRAGEALAFSFVNAPSRGGAGPATHLMVFARDSAGQVYWFWPAWDDPAADPASVPIPATASPLELGESVRHPLRPGPLTFFGLFSDRALHVREIEAALAQRGPAALASFGGWVWAETLEVAP
jgi:hypothetical protein